MTKHRNKLYLFLSIAWIAGYIWFFINFFNTEKNTTSINACVIKSVTNIPCPSCGTTRSIILLSKGNFIESLATNPFGYIVGFILITLPIWLTFDIITKKSTFYVFYKKIESAIRKPKIAIPLIVFVLVNWIWNIYKGL